MKSPTRRPRNKNMTHPLVVHLKRSRYDVRIDRATKWGNPYVIGTDGTREDVIRKYADWLPTQPHLMKSLPELQGRVLGCWCAPQACHGDVLATLAAEATEDEIERVARAICNKVYPATVRYDEMDSARQDNLMDIARAAIAAMRTADDDSAIELARRMTLKPDAALTKDTP